MKTGIGSGSNISCKVRLLSQVKPEIATCFRYNLMSELLSSIAKQDLRNRTIADHEQRWKILSKNTYSFKVTNDAYEMTHTNKTYRYHKGIIVKSREKGF